ncbi:uncharacterized protein B0H18DRAFT_527638 [Fomitopsis serialis]|uniref:uncharacterized protein n=1 Tax=Fomitopsis serialis TaxID=139415 RepID=UPI002007D619|nr:uncharacterized protein B0H18DRAFT_527638 [Neoantrodia serialis]KAH9922116.1 hypothetical protein B0H18DRAFT_527638 [Neoantrodia serialis]
MSSTSWRRQPVRGSERRSRGLSDDSQRDGPLSRCPRRPRASCAAVAQRSHTTLASLISNKVGAYKEAVRTFMKTFEQYDKVFGRASQLGKGGMVTRTYWKFHWRLWGKDKPSIVRTVLSAAYLDLGATVALLVLHVTSGVPNPSGLTVYHSQTGNSAVRKRTGAASMIGKGREIQYLPKREGAPRAQADTQSVLVQEGYTGDGNKFDLTAI